MCSHIYKNNTYPSKLYTYMYFEYLKKNKKITALIQSMNYINASYKKPLCQKIDNMKNIM